MPFSSGSDDDFNPRAPCGARPWTAVWRTASSAFQSTRPVRGATTSSPPTPPRRPYFNPRAPCGARLTRPHPAACRGGISIHAPRAGRDDGQASPDMFGIKFQSTRPVRGATWTLPTRENLMLYFNPRAPCGARPQSTWYSDFGKNFNPRAPCGARLLFQVFQRLRIIISIHAPRAGRDVFTVASPQQVSRFQSTRPVRGATTGTPANSG